MLSCEKDCTIKRHKQSFYLFMGWRSCTYFLKRARDGWVVADSRRRRLLLWAQEMWWWKCAAETHVACLDLVTSFYRITSTISETLTNVWNDKIKKEIVHTVCWVVLHALLILEDCFIVLASSRILGEIVCFFYGSCSDPLDLEGITWGFESSIKWVEFTRLPKSFYLIVISTMSLIFNMRMAIRIF